MSLISMRNVISPFTNKVHLITIILVSLLFGLFRLSSGTIRIVPRGDSSNRSLVSEPEHIRPSNEINKPRTAVDSAGNEASEDLDPRNEIARLGGQKNVASGRTAPNAQAKESRDDVLGEMIGNKAKTEKLGAERKNREEPSGLSDIEKKLGLR